MSAADSRAPAITWALRLDAGAPLTGVAALRTAIGVEVGIHENELWLRGPDLGDALRQQLLTLPCAARFVVDEDGRCRRPRARIPATRLPSVAWQPLGTWATLVLPPSAMPAAAPRPLPLRLVRSDRTQPANALVLPFARLAAWTLTAVHARLHGLAFAVCSDGRALVVAPERLPTLPALELPPLPGTAFVVRAGVALPVGFRFAPDVPATVVAQRLQLGPGAIACFAAGEGDARPELLAASSFVALTRSAVRSTHEAAP